jgi:hypothetical protein
MYLIRWNESDDHPKFLGGQNQRSGHSRNPSTHFFSSSLPSVTRRIATHRVTVGPVQEEDDSTTTGPSPARVPTDGWTRRRRVARWRGPTRAHAQGSRSDGVL